MKKPPPDYTKYDKREADPLKDLLRAERKREFLENAKENDPKNPVIDVKRASAGTSVEDLFPMIESAYRLGDKVKSGGKDGHEAVYGTQEETDQRHRIIEKEYLSVRGEHPDWSLERIYEKVSRILTERYPGQKGYGRSSVDHRTRDLRKI